MKYPEEMYIDSQIFAGDMDGSESNLTEKVVKIRKPTRKRRKQTRSIIEAIFFAAVFRILRAKRESTKAPFTFLLPVTL